MSKYSFLPVAECNQRENDYIQIKKRKKASLFSAVTAELAVCILAFGASAVRMILMLG